MMKNTGCLEKCTPPQSPTSISRQPRSLTPPHRATLNTRRPHPTAHQMTPVSLKQNQQPPPPSEQPDPQRPKNSTKPRPPKFQPLRYVPKTFSRSSDVLPGQTSIDRKMEKTSVKTCLFKLSGSQIHRQIRNLM